MTHKVVHSKFNELFSWKEDLWSSRYNHIRGKIYKPWSIEQIKLAICSLKNNKTRDPHGWLNETFKDCAQINPYNTKNSPGADDENDLVMAMYFMMNGIKQNMHVPEFMKLGNITSIYKNKGSRQNLENDRGIFILPVLKKILDKLIYLDFYDSINSNMSDSNIGARKEQNVRNHLFLIYGIINNVIKDREESIHLHFFLSCQGI